jgi:hypothetical protein
MLEGLLLTLDVLAMLLLMRWSIVQERARKAPVAPKSSMNRDRP